MTQKNLTQREAVEKILKQDGLSYQKWSKDQLIDAATKVLKGQDNGLKTVILDYLETQLINDFVGNKLKSNNKTVLENKESK